VQQQDDTERRIALLNQPAPPADEIRRSLEEYQLDVEATGRPSSLLRRLAAQACGRVQDQECVVTLGKRTKYDSDPDVQQAALDALVARCGSGGREVLADVVSYRAGVVARDTCSEGGQPQKPAEVAPTTRHKAHKAKKSTDKTPAVPAAPTDAALVEAVTACPSADSVFLLVNAGYDGLEALLAATKVPPAEDRLLALKAIVVLPPPLELARVALTDAETKARHEAEAHLAAGREALAASDFDKATREASAAESLGVAAADLKAATTVARDVEFKRHVQKARALVKKDDPDGAMAEVNQAEALVGGSGSLKELREAIAKTPTARRRERIRQAEERRLERMRRVEEARVAAEARKPGARETPSSVRDLRRGPCRYDAIGGRLVARIGPHTYEFVPMNRSCVTDVLQGGSVAYEAEGRDALGNYYCEHALLEATRTKFSSSGTFDSCVRPVFRIRNVPLKNGFSQKVRVWTEDTDGPITPGRRPWPGGG
jgi:hypothetical protein